jgi:hypothetical protein
MFAKSNSIDVKEMPGRKLRLRVALEWILGRRQTLPNNTGGI